VGPCPAQLGELGLRRHKRANGAVARDVAQIGVVAFVVHLHAAARMLIIFSEPNACLLDIHNDGAEAPFVVLARTDLS